MKPHRAGEGERSLAVFIDFENMGLGFNNRRDRFEIHKVLERLVEKGKIVAKKAYADWSRFSQYTAGLHEAAIELVEIPRRGVSGKNSADIRLVVDAIDLAYSKDHIDTFVIVSGDSDFSPLVSKLKELGKHVIGLGLVDATSDLLRDNCDEFIYYEDLDRAPIIPVSVNAQIPEKKRKGFALLLDSLLALRRENKEVIYSSMVKDTMKRKKPSFNEEYYGYRTFSELLEDAQKEGLVELEKHKSSGMYIVTRFGLEMKSGTNGGRSGVSPPPPRPAAEESRDRRTPTRTERTEREQPEQRGDRRDRAGRDRAPVPPSPPPAARPAPVPEEPESPEYIDRPLGRALVEEIELDEEPVEEVPSYGPKRPAPAKPAAAAKPAASAKAPTKASAPAAPKTGQAKSGGRSGGRSGSSGRSGSGRSGSRREPAAEPKPAPAAAPKTPPSKPAEDDDEFGAGLDV
jgi:uncharacterized protein (TIGR00288 family)